MNTILVLILSFSASARTISSTPERVRLLAEIEQGCVSTDKSGDPPRIVTAKCACVKAQHTNTTPTEALTIISDHYNARKNFDTPEITDNESLALDIYFDIHSECKSSTAEKKK